MKKKQKVDPSQNLNSWSDWNKIWHSWLRRQADPLCKSLCKSVYGGGASRQRANRWNIRKFFLFLSIYVFFLPLIYRSDFSADFCTLWLKRRGLAQKCAFWGL